MGGAWLALMAGTVNTTGLLGAEQRAVTHLSGTTTLGAAAFAQGHFGIGLHLFAIVASFFVGAVVSALIIRDSTLRLGRRYGWALMLESVLLCIAVPLFGRSHPVGDYFVAAASGLQNAMATTYSGAVLRTTHVTGIVTDLGILVGDVLRGRGADERKAVLLGSLLGGFVLGSALGAVLYGWMGPRALGVPALTIGVAGAAYVWYRHLHRLPTVLE